MQEIVSTLTLTLTLVFISLSKYARKTVVLYAFIFIQVQHFCFPKLSCGFWNCFGKGFYTIDILLVIAIMLSPSIVHVALCVSIPCHQSSSFHILHKDRTLMTFPYNSCVILHILAKICDIYLHCSVWVKFVLTCTFCGCITGRGENFCR